jgi:long-chain fatty acid transport protein
MSTSRLLRRPPRQASVAFLAASVSLVSIGLGLGLERTAHATGFLTDQFGSDHGHPALANAYSIYFNPAAMAGMRGSDLTLDGVVAARSLSFNRSASALQTTGPEANDPTYQAANTGQATLFNVLAAPFLGFVTDFGGSSWRLGVAGYVPFGGSISWQKNQQFAGYPGAPGAYDGSQRWASISTTTSSIYGTAALAYRFEKLHLGLGASVSVIRTAVQDTRAHDVDGSDTVTLGSSIYEGRSYLDVSGVQVGAAAGVYWEPTPSLHLGASYTSQPNFGTMRLNGTFKLYESGTTLSANSDLLQAYPDVIRLGGAWRVAPDAELRLDLGWQRWSLFKNQCVVDAGDSCNVNGNGSASSTGILVNVPRNFQDAVKVRLGGAYWVQPQTEIFGSFAFETSPVPTAYEDALLFDSTRLYGTLGVRHGFTEHVYASAAYTYVYFLPVTVTDSAYAGYAAPSKSPSENGTYSSQLYILDASISYVF